MEITIYVMPRYIYCYFVDLKKNCYLCRPETYDAVNNGRVF